jgi:hypothetical protein
VGVALGGGHSGVAEDLLNDPDVHTLLDEERRGGVPCIVHSDVPDAGLLEDGLPLLPVLGALDGGSVIGREHQVVVFPPVSGLLPRSVLYLAVCLELGEELGRALEGELALALALAEDQAAAGSLGVLVRVAGAVVETGPLVADVVLLGAARRTWCCTWNQARRPSG